MRVIRTFGGVVLVLLLLAGLISAGGVGGATRVQARDDVRPVNVIWVLVDDLSWDLIRHMSQVRAMQRNGVTFDNYYVSDSLCCPSRASMLAGRFPHNTGVLTNSGPNGGFTAWSQKPYDNQHRTFAYAAQQHGYVTGFIGKYLNGMRITAGTPAPNQAGWDFWRPYGRDAYSETASYPVGNGPLPAATSDVYVTDRMNSDAQSFLEQAPRTGDPFLLEVATYAPHSSVSFTYQGREFPPAPRDVPRSADNPDGEFTGGDCGTRNGKRTDCTDIRVENLPGNADLNCRHDRRDLPRAHPDGDGINPPCELQQYLRDRVRMVQAVNDIVGGIRRTLTERHLWRDTYLVFSSDNGFHLGQGVPTPQGGHAIGKGTARETDLHVPLVVEGGEARHGVLEHSPAQSVDLGPTFLDMQPNLMTPGTAGTAGAAFRLIDQDGRSLLPLIRGERAVRPWRQWVYAEHTSNARADPRSDPDAEPATMNQRTYHALRAGDELFVRYPNGDGPTTYEYYRIRETADGRITVRRPWSAVEPRRRAIVVNMFELFAGCGGGWNPQNQLGTDPVDTSCQRIAMRPFPPRR